jgi:hypothetical protein
MVFYGQADSLHKLSPLSEVAHGNKHEHMDMAQGWVPLKLDGQ